MRINQKTKDRWTADTKRVYSAVTRAGEMIAAAHAELLEFGDPTDSVIEAEYQIQIAFDAIRDIRASLEELED